MFVLKHILWIIVTLYIHALLPLVCNASAEIKDNWMEEDENIDTKILSKLRRRLLDTGDNNSSFSEFLIYFIALFIFALLLTILKCCKDMIRSAADEDIPHITQHPPPACRITDISGGSAQPRYSTRLPSSSRPLAPPRTSTSIILLPEERQFDSFFIGIANPLYNASISDEQVRRDANTSISNEQVRRDVNASISNEQVRYFNTSISNEEVRRDVSGSIFTEQVRREFNSPISDEQERTDGNPLQNPTDMPPNYESAVKDDEKYTVYNIQDGPPYDEPPPKYSEFQN